MSFYQIVWDKLFFSDMRFDTNRSEIINVFKVSDIIPTLHSMNPTYIKVLNSEKHTEFFNMVHNIEEKVKDCRHKAEAIWFSLWLILWDISQFRSPEDFDSYSEMIKNKMCTYVEIKSDVLLYEVESFLFQISTNLDISIQLLKHAFRYLKWKSNDDRESFKWEWEKAWYKTIKKMRENWDWDLADFFQSLVDDWYQELHWFRNIITHRSNLKWFTNYVYNCETREIIEPKMPNWESVQEYCKDCYNKILSFYDELFTKFIIPKIIELHSKLS